jgi:galactose-1-phosphate uridylyltransferase
VKEGENMSNYNTYFIKMQDGTIKQINPFTGTEVWTVPGRASKPITNDVPESAKKLDPDRKKEDYCNFCEAKYLNTPPEKDRLVKIGEKFLPFANLKPIMLEATKPAFRRIPNLFEIVTMEYWKKNFDLKLSEEVIKAKDDYLSDKKGYEHVMNVVNMKLKLLGLDPAKVDESKKLDYADAFFAGGHELIVAQRHFIKGAQYDTQLCSSGELNPAEHKEYLKFTIRGMLNIYANNKYVRYVSIFQNWLKPAGASFDHLHKQLVAIDEWGVSIEREMALLRRNPNIYNEMGANLAAYFNLVLAENDHAIAFADIGHRYPTICIFSKSTEIYPYDLKEKELSGFSDILHAIHAALTSQIATNEEWYYTPKDSIDIMPWHILIKLRINTPAGFEGGTKIYINPTSPYDLRDRLITRLQELRKDKKIAKMTIGAECEAKPNPLRYYQRGAR